MEPHSRCVFMRFIIEKQLFEIYISTKLYIRVDLCVKNVRTKILAIIINKIFLSEIRNRLQSCCRKTWLTRGQH